MFLNILFGFYKYYKSVFYDSSVLILMTVHFLHQYLCYNLGKMLKTPVKIRVFIGLIIKMHYSQFFLEKRVFFSSVIDFCNQKCIKPTLCVFLICFFCIKFIFRANFLKY